MTRNVPLLMLLLSALLAAGGVSTNPPATAASTQVAVGGDSTIDTVFGNGVQLPFSASDLGKSALDVPLTNSLQSGMAIGPDGTLYITMPSRVVKVGPDGIVRPVVGLCVAGHPRYPACINSSTGDGGPALDATVSSAVQGLSLGPDGSLYIGDRYRVRRIGPDGIIRTVAGGDEDGFSGDGGPALAATFGNGSFTIADVDVAQDGTIYVTDTGNHRIRKIAPDGIVSTVGGKAGNPPNCWEIPASGSATDVFLFYPRTVTIGPDGALYVSSSSCAAVRRIAGGTSTLLVEGFDGDGDGIASFGNQGNGIAFGLDNTLYLTHYYGNADNVVLARPAGANGTILGASAIVAGEVAVGYRFSGDGGPAKSAELAAPSTLVTAPDGSLYVLDALNYRVRRIGARYSTTISPASGATMSTLKNDISIGFPAGAVNAQTNVTLSTAGRPSRPASGFRPTRFFVSLGASSGGAPLTRFSKPYTLNLTYQNADLAGVGDEARLNLYLWDGAQWKAALPCAGCSVDRANNRVTLVLDRPGDFALMAPAPSGVYLPLLSR